MSNPLLQQAVLAHQAGDLAGAENHYRAVLALEPDDADALALLGSLYSTGGRHNESLEFIKRAMAVDSQSALFRLYYGNALMAAHRTSEAQGAFREALALKPTLAEAHYNLANALRASDDWNSAISSYKNALLVRPHYPEACNNLALCYVHKKNYEEALVAARQAVHLAPNYGEGWITVCNVAEKTKNYNLGLEAGECAIRLAPQIHYSWFGYAVILNRLDRHEDAIVAYHQALSLSPDCVDIWDNLGQSYQAVNKLEEAEMAYRKTIEVSNQIINNEDSRDVKESEYGNRHWHLALIELLRGKYQQGFARYRARFKDVGGLKRPVGFFPLWEGEDLAGKTILVYDEQGFGDTLMLARYLPLIKARGGRVIFSIHPALKALFEGWSGADIVIAHNAPPPAYDYFVSVFDLPHRFNTTLETIPKTIPYLPVLSATQATKLEDTDLLKVGVVWGGNKLHANDERRSVPLSACVDVFSEVSVRFYSLNREMREGDEALLTQYPVINLASSLKDFSDTARFIHQMDLVITCDTSTAHLAGGLGVPTWVVLPYAPDWRWLTGRDDSPWYPTIRLFRQRAIGNWKEVMERVREALRTQPRLQS